MKKSAFPINGNWYKGNIHSHTTISDGALDPDVQMNLYAEHGYDFLSFTDHNIMTNLPEWRDGKILMISGWERDISYIYKVKCTHIIGLSGESFEKERFQREPGDMNKMSDQDLIDQMRADGNEFIEIAHPAWSRMEIEELLKLDNYNAMEVFNTGTECLCHEGHAEYVYDTLLRHGKRIWAVACDDTHGHTAKDDHFGGWIMVKAEKCDKNHILDAMINGNFYSTMGPEIYDFGMKDDNTAYISCSSVNEVHFITYPARGKANFGSDIKEMEYTLKGGEQYIRVEVIDSNGKRAWTNPIFF